MRKLTVVLALICMITAGLTVIQASSLPTYQGAVINSVGTVGTAPGYYSIGWTFDLVGAYPVTHLGYYDPAAVLHPILVPHDVAIYECDKSDCTGVNTMVVGASATVLPTDPIQNDFLWHQIPMVTLTTGTYVIAGTSENEYWMYDQGSLTFASQVTWQNGRFSYLGASSSPLQFPGGPYSNVYSYFGPNFGNVPEPSSMILGGLGLLAIGYFRRRR